MATYYPAENWTNCDIEVWVGNVLDGWPNTDGVDEVASQEQAERLIERALMDAYPQRTVHVGTARHGEPWFAIARFPNDVDPEQIAEVAAEALGETAERYVVMTENGDDKGEGGAE